MRFFFPPDDTGALRRAGRLCLARGFSAVPGVAHLETLTAKPDVVTQLAGKFLLETGGVLAGNAVLAGAPARRGTLAGQHLRANAQRDEIGTQASLPGLASRDPFLDAGDANASQSKGCAETADLVIELCCRIVKASVRWKTTRPNHVTDPLRMICLKRCDTKLGLICR